MSYHGQTIKNTNLGINKSFIGVYRGVSKCRRKENATGFLVFGAHLVSINRFLQGKEMLTGSVYWRGK